MAESDNALIQQEIQAISTLDNAAAMATGNRADHVAVQQATLLLRAALEELGGYRESQNEQADTIIADNGQGSEPETVPDIST